ncbi:hypothetical protein [Streptomyces xanthophaeus]
MAYYRDGDGAIWIEGHRPDQVYCLADPDFPEDADDAVLGIPMSKNDIRRTAGPLVPIRPTGWEEV